VPRLPVNVVLRRSSTPLIRELPPLLLVACVAAATDEARSFLITHWRTGDQRAGMAILTHTARLVGWLLIAVAAFIITTAAAPSVAITAGGCTQYIRPAAVAHGLIKVAPGNGYFLP